MDSLKKISIWHVASWISFWTHTQTFHETRAQGNLETAFDFWNSKESFGSSADLITCNSALGHWNGGWQMAEEFLSWIQGRQLRSDVVPWSWVEMAWFLKYNPTKELLADSTSRLSSRISSRNLFFGCPNCLFSLDGWGQVGHLCWMHSFTWAPWLLCKCVAIKKHKLLFTPFLASFLTPCPREDSWFPSKMEGFHLRWDQWIHLRYSFN